MNDICSICGQRREVHRQRKTKKLVCPACYQREFHLEQCSVCKKLKPVKFRTETGKAVCPACYKRERRAKLASSV